MFQSYFDIFSSSISDQPCNSCIEFGSDTFYSSAAHPVANSVRTSLDINERAQLEVSFCSNKPVRAQTKILMRLEDNKHITTTIQVIGEACQEIVSFHDINKSRQEIDLDVDEGKKERKKERGIMWLKEGKDQRGERCLHTETLYTVKLVTLLRFGLLLVCL